jgi:hypothetical protein
MLAIPDSTAHRTKLADWLELACLNSPFNRIGFSTLTSASALSEDTQAEDDADEDLWSDALVLTVQLEINRRRKHIGDDYPFRIDEKGESMHFNPQLTQAGAIYLFCLYISHAADRAVLAKKHAPRMNNKLRDLFQACATIAAAGFVQGPAISFGWPRPDKSNFLKALKRAYKIFGDGTPHAAPRPAAKKKKVKDSGIDIIAWRPSIDGLPCTQYVIGQVASGKDWVDKSVVAEGRHFHKYWFEYPPASQHQDAMFMPFGLEPLDPEDGTPYEDVLADYMQSLGYEYGNVFYRDRISKYAKEGLRIAEAGEQNIERVADVPKIVKWVASYSKRLSAA